MRKVIMFLMMLSMSIVVQAQDVVITKEGNALKVYGLEVTASAVFYRESAEESAPIVRKKKADLLMIKYSDGRKEIIDDDSQNEESVTATQQQQAPAMEEFTAEDASANEAALAKWKNFPAGKMKEKNKKAAFLCCVLRPDKASHIADRNVELSFHGQNTLLSWRNNIAFVLSVKNKTNKTIYLDLSNSFFIRGEQSQAYFVPTASSFTTGTSTAVGVNMGAVAGAMGVDGKAGKLASGINVGKGSSKYNTTVTYSQRVIAIPPMSTKSLDAMEIRQSNLKMRSVENDYLPRELSVSKIINRGASVDFEEGEVPVKFGSFITYSFTEDIQSPRELQVSYSVRRIIGLPEGKDLGVGTGNANGKDLTDDQLNDVFCIIRQAK